MTPVILLILIVIMLCLLIYLGRPIKKAVPNHLLLALKELQKKNWKLLVRPSGDIAGIIHAEEPYIDEAHDIKRRRFRFCDLDGKERTEPRDGVNIKRGSIEDLIPIEKDGGVAITMLSNPGDIVPIITGPQAAEMKTGVDDDSALKREYDRIQKEYLQKDRNYQDLQQKCSRLLEQVNDHRTTIEDLEEGNVRLIQLNRRIEGRLAGQEAMNTALERELKSFGERHKELQEEVQNALRKARERSKETMMIRAGEVEAEDKPPKKAPKKKAVKKEKKEKETE